MDNAKRVRKPFKAYKAFDKNLTCRGFQYKIGSIYQYRGKLNLCGSGFHASKKCSDIFNYYYFNSRKTRVCEVLIRGRVIEGEAKVCCSRIEILRELSWDDILGLCNIGIGNSGNWNSGDGNSGNKNSGYKNSGNKNSGKRNSGHWNSGSENSGYRNSGDSNSGNNNLGYRNSGYWNLRHCNSGNSNSGSCNSGDCNSGDCNSGFWNSCDNESGHLNTKSSDTIRVFNKPCNKAEWDKAEIPDFFHFRLTEWVEDDSKAEGGYLKNYTYEEAWSKAWADAPESDRRLLEELPNFDWEVFTELTGIEKPENW
jgi:hypothetical protein